MRLLVVVGISVSLVATPVAAQTRSREAARCVLKAATSGLEKYPPTLPQMTDEQRATLGEMMDRNHEKRATQIRRCLSETDAKSLGRLNYFINAQAAACRFGPAAILRAKPDPGWSDTDLLNGAALAYLKSGPGRFDVGGAFVDGENEARALARSGGLNGAATCQLYWREFGSNGTTFPGLIVRLER